MRYVLATIMCLTMVGLSLSGCGGGKTFHCYQYCKDEATGTLTEVDQVDVGAGTVDDAQKACEGAFKCTSGTSGATLCSCNEPQGA